MLFDWPGVNHIRPLIMSGGPYIYDPESKKFVTRVSSETQAAPVSAAPEPAVPEDIPAPPPKVNQRQPLSRERRKLMTWLASVVLFLAWLLLLAVWTRQLSWRSDVPTAAPRRANTEFPKESFPK